MPSRTALSRFIGLLSLTGAAALTGCVASDAPATGMTGSGGASDGSGGRDGSGGSGSGGAGSGGASMGSGGSPGSGGAPAPIDAATIDLVPEVSGEAAASGWAGIPDIEDLSTVKATMGCGADPGQALGSWVRFTVTIPPPAANRGTGNRVYFIKLPASYNKDTRYRVIFIGPGCNGSGDKMYDFTDAAGAEGVIQIGVSPDPGASQNGLCFDDKRTASVEYKFIETVLELTSKKLCYDQHRVFFTGHSSGSWLSNQMGCVLGSKTIRAVAPSSGGLADRAGEAPPCTQLPTPGIWSHNEDDTGNPIVGSKVAINRALRVNKCQGTYDTSKREPYTAIGTADGICEKFSSCPAEFPIVLCHPKTGGHLGNLGPQPARSWQFFKSLP